MRTEDGFPAPDRDMANVEPEVPPAESDVSPLTSSVFPLLTIAMGVAACLWGAFGLVVEGNPAPISAIAMLGAGVCFIVSGILMMRSSGLLFPIIAAACGILLGIVSNMMKY